MKNSTAAKLLEESLSIVHVLRIAIGLAFLAILSLCVVGELMTSDFDRSFHWFWIGAGTAYLLSYAIQWTVEGEAQRYRELGED